MPNPLNLFPARVPIGRLVGPDGRAYDVLMTTEFSRALADLLVRVGGTNNLSNDELAALLGAEPTSNSIIASLQNQLAEQEAEAASVASMAARMAQLERTVAYLQNLVASSGPAPVDWEHPGKVGAAKANSGKFTTLAASGAASFNPLDANVELKPTGTGSVFVGPVQQGAIDNMQLGITTPAPARVTTLQTDQLATVTKGAKFSGATALGATAVSTFSYEAPHTRFYIGDGTGYSFRFAKRTGGATTDVATVTDQGAVSFAAGFGCNGKAAQAPAASGGTLAGVISALVANGILSS